VQGRFEGASLAFLKRPSPRAHQEYLKISFARGMCVLKMLKGNPLAEDKRRKVIQDNFVALTSLKILRAAHPEIHSEYGKQLTLEL
jgi:hypothetical protein